MNKVHIISVLCGGAAGSLCRYEIQAQALNWYQGIFPFSLLGINIAGSFLMGLLLGILRRSGVKALWVSLALGVGFLGGFTTFSTFALDTFKLFASDQPLLAIMNLVLSPVLCISAAGLGYGLFFGQKDRSASA